MTGFDLICDLRYIVFTATEDGFELICDLRYIVFTAIEDEVSECILSNYSINYEPCYILSKWCYVNFQGLF